MTHFVKRTWSESRTLEVLSGYPVHDTPCTMTGSTSGDLSSQYNGFRCIHKPSVCVTEVSGRLRDVVDGVKGEGGPEGGEEGEGV